MKNPAHILLVDDNRMDVELVLDAFEEGRLENKVSVANDGQQALDYLFGEREYADRLKYPIPNLVLLDLKMPGIDGHEVLRRIKEDKTIRRIPVIILTSSKEEGDLALSYDCGANSYLVKPISFEGFIKIVRQIEEYWIMLNVGPSED